MKKLDYQNIIAAIINEMTSTGAGPGSATMTTGIGDAVPAPKAFKKKSKKEDKEPKLAAGKVKNNYAVSHFGFTPAPSIPNRKSKTMDYKEVWGVDEAYDKSKIKTNTDELARVVDYLKSATSSQKSSAEDRIKKLKFLVSLEKKYNTELPVLHYGTPWVDYLKKQGAKDYKELEAKLSTKKGDLNEENVGEVDIPDNIKKFAQRKGITDIVNQVARWAEKMGKKIVGGTAIGKDYGTLILDLTHQGGEIRINTDTDEIEINDQDIIDFESFADAVDSLSEPLNENYASFRNQTSKRSAPEQIHEAVKQIKKRLIEVNRLLEYTERLKMEVSEGTNDDFKYKTYTERALEQITEMVKQTYIKTKKLK